MKYLVAGVALTVILIGLALVGAEELRFRIWVKREKKAILERIQRKIETEDDGDDDDEMDEAR